MFASMLKVIRGDLSEVELAMFSAGILYSAALAGLFVLIVYVAGWFA